MRWSLALIASIFFLFASSTSAFAATLLVGPGKDYAKPCLAIAAAHTGDTIQVDAAGNYAGDNCAWSTDNLTVIGVNGRAKIDLTGIQPADASSTFRINAPNATIENMEFTGVFVTAGAGAGIRHSGTNLTIRGCYFHDNQQGLLGASASAGTGTILIENSEFARNGAGDGSTHNIYLNSYNSVTMRDSYSHDAIGGHLIKSRANNNFLLYNRFTDEAGTASYEIDLPNGGTHYIIGNLIEKGAAASNPNSIACGAEGAVAAGSTLYVVNNTIVNDASTTGTFINVTSYATTLANNIFRGRGTLTNALTPTLQTNWTDLNGDPKLTNQAAFDYHLRSDSPCIDMGTALLPTADLSLVANQEYIDVNTLWPRTKVGTAIDLGAYEFGLTASVDAGVPTSDAGITNDAGLPGADGGGADSGAGNGDAGGPAGGSSGNSGCGCTVGTKAPISLAWWASAVGLGVGLVRRSRRRQRSERRRR